MMSILFRVLLVVVLVSVIGIFVYFKILPHFVAEDSKNESPEVTTDSKNVQPGALSAEMKAFDDEFTKTFWLETDYQSTYEQLNKKYNEVMKQNAAKSSLTPQELQDQMFVQFNYAVVARYVNPEESLQLYASMYNNQTYTKQMRAEALFDAMYFLAGEYESDLSIKQVNDWIFASGRFRSVLEGTELEGKYLSRDNEVLLAGIYGFNKALELTDSKKTQIKIKALKYDLQARLFTQSIIDEYQKTNGTPAGLDEYAVKNLSSEQMQRIDVLAQNYLSLEKSVIEGLSESNGYAGYTKEFLIAAKNLVRGYTLLQSIGLQVDDNIGTLYASAQAYTKHLSEKEDVDEVDLKQAELLMGVISFYKSCSVVLETDYLQSGESLQTNLEPYLKAFYALSPQGRSRFYMVKNAGEAAAGYCYWPTVHMGKNLPAMREALILDIGGWEDADFK